MGGPSLPMAIYRGFGLSHTHLFGVNLINFFSEVSKELKVALKNCLTERIRMMYVSVSDGDYLQNYGRISQVSKNDPILRPLLIYYSQS